MSRLRYDITHPSARHQHPLAQIIAVLSGVWSDESQNDVRTLKYGDLLFHPAGTTHSHTVAASTEAMLIDIGPRLVKEICSLYGNRSRKLQFSFDVLEGLPERIAKEVLHNDPLTPHLVDCLLRLMLTLGARVVEHAAATTPWLTRVLSFVDAHLAEPIAVTDLATVACVSESKFTRAFRDATGSSPAAYVRTRRLRVATRLLRQTELSIHEVAAASGFYDQAHFCRVFKAAERVTPVEYRRRRQTMDVVDGPFATVPPSPGRQPAAVIQPVATGVTCPPMSIDCDPASPRTHTCRRHGRASAHPE